MHIFFSMDKAEIQRLSEFWQEASARDFLTATDIFNRTENNVAVLFFIHLTLEKILKALYVTTKGAHAPFSHNLLFLIKETGIDVHENDRQLLSEINEFNIEARYPDEKFLFTRRLQGILRKSILKIPKGLTSGYQIY